MTLLKIKNIAKNFVTEFGLNVPLLENISFEVESSESVVILAPKFSGKTALLKIIAGLEKEDSGEVERKGSVVYIPSAPSSFPWLTVRENIIWAFPEIDEEKLKAIIELVGLDGYENHLPHNKSYGFRFRTAFARALALQPDLILLDETFSRMRHDIKKDIYNLILEAKNDMKFSVLLATSSVSEAVELGDKIIQLSKNPGRIISVLEKSEFANKFAENWREELKREIEKIFLKAFENSVLELSI
jgi:ABC-type nitrate/sulfonate/bicarbonate transport system ATPase subunit